jgi:hypothetical protein
LTGKDLNYRSPKIETQNQDLKSRPKSRPIIKTLKTKGKKPGFKPGVGF